MRREMATTHSANSAGEHVPVSYVEPRGDESLARSAPSGSARRGPSRLIRYLLDDEPAGLAPDEHERAQPRILLVPLLIQFPEQSFREARQHLSSVRMPACLVVAEAENPGVRRHPGSTTSWPQWLPCPLRMATELVDQDNAGGLSAPVTGREPNSQLKERTHSKHETARGFSG